MISTCRSRRRKFQAALDYVTTWSSEVEAKLASVDESVVVTGKRLNEIKKGSQCSGGRRGKRFFAEEKERAFGI